MPDKIEQFMKAMDEGVADQTEMMNALQELVTKVSDLESEVDRVEEEKDQSHAHLSCQIDDLREDVNQLLDMHDLNDANSK